MKISNDGSNGKYIYVENKLSDEKTLYDKTENNEKSVNVNDEQVMVTNLEKNIANTDNFYYLINKSIYKAREVRDVFPTEVNEQNFQTEALINLIKRAKDNITNLISIKNTNEYLKLKEEIYHLQLKITNEKRLFSVLKSQDELSPMIKEDIRIHERTIKLYRDILFLAEKSTIINHIYQLGFNLNLNHISKIIDKMEEIENAISKFDDLNRSTDKEDFNQQKEKIIKDLDDFTKSINMGRELLNDHFIKIIQDEINSKLSAISPTPIGFSLHNIFQQKIDYQLQHTDSNDEKTVLQSIYKIDQLTNLFNIKYRFDYSGLTQDIIKTYALQKIYSIYNTDKHAFGELSIEDIINTEIIYSYTAPNNNTQYSTFTIFDYLTRHINDMNSLLIKRENINIRFPVEYRAELINYLDEEAKNLKKQIDLINNINSLKEEKDKLQEKMPNLEKYLEIYLAKISKEHNVDSTSLDDLVEFRYKAYSFNPELNAAINNINPPVEKLYTVRDILLGRERKWLSENTNYKLDEVLGALYPTQYTKKLSVK
ncbi:hypothetical protein [Arsenophonus apicola]|uniref:Uncharacterized protein n=1 Tax=Arsenophonus apicola TaxID=2879119 RepID=A0ABY8P1L8_9GAMM|nr:hypothetical protein [Arsenophonus apicola]WGO82941.1 hypothetical protein QG404_11385 [Arsenophonus apicola]